MSRSREYEWARRMLLWELHDGPKDEREIRTASETRWDPTHDSGARYVVASRRQPKQKAWALNGTPPRVPWPTVKLAAHGLGISRDTGTIFREGGRGDGHWMWGLPSFSRDPNALPPDARERAQVCRCDRPVAYKTRHYGGDVRCVNCARLVSEAVAV